MFRKIKTVLVIVAVFQMVTIYSMEEQQLCFEEKSCKMVQHNVSRSNKKTAGIPQWMNEKKYQRNEIALSLKYCAFNNSILLRDLSEEIKKRIISLNLSYNRLRFLPEEISKLSNLETFNLRGNDSLGKGALRVVCSLSNLKSLNLSYNGLKSLPVEISKLSNLETFNLRGNDLLGKEALRVVCSLSNLKSLDLGSNRLRSLPVEISQLSNLEKLYLRGNDLLGKGALSVVCFLSNLKFLDLSSNGLKSLPEGIISSLSNLETFNLGDNDLSGEGILRVVCSLPKLEFFNLSNNGLDAYWEKEIWRSLVLRQAKLCQKK